MERGEVVGSRGCAAVGEVGREGEVEEEVSFGGIGLG